MRLLLFVYFSLIRNLFTKKVILEVIALRCLRLVAVSQRLQFRRCIKQEGKPLRTHFYSSQSLCHIYFNPAIVFPDRAIIVYDLEKRVVVTGCWNRSPV